MGAERTGLRILMTADTIGGVWPFAMELASQLTQLGDRVLLAAMGREPDTAQRREANAIRGVELHACPYKLAWMQEPWDELETARQWLHELAEGFMPDIVHLNDLAHGDSRWPAPVLMTAHSCVCSWWQAVHGEPAPREWLPYRAHVASNLQSVDRVVAPTRAMLRVMHHHYGALPATEVIHNGRTAFGHSAVGKEPIVLGAGRLWDEAKNLRTLAAVAPRLPWPVYLAGDTRDPQGNETELANAHVLGLLPYEEVQHWMRRAAIYALPARYEPFGLSALEAAQSGCALVLGDIPSLREVWGNSAAFVPPNDAAALEAVIGALIRDDKLRENMARRAQARARRYTPSAMALRYRNVYLDLITRRRNASGLARPRSIPLTAGAHA
jgi:glycosyltransferase involved in cell wall biosynthesis